MRVWKRGMKGSEKWGRREYHRKEWDVEKHLIGKGKLQSAHIF